MANSSPRWFSRMGEGRDDFTTQNSTISEDEETRELSLSPDSHASSKVSKIEFSFITPLENCRNGPKNKAKMEINLLSLTNKDHTSSNKLEQVCKIEGVDEMYLCDHKYKIIKKLGEGCKRKRIDKDHNIIAERKRREKLCERFVALSAILPGLKKVDKASILEQAIKHVKELQQKVQLLEQRKNGTQKSLMIVNKSQLEDHDNYSSSHGKNNIEADIEARIADKNVLIRIICERHRGFLLNIYNEVEKLHLTILQSSMMPFGNRAIHFTLVAQMEDSFCMTLKDLVKHVRMVTAKLMNQA